MTRTPKFTTEMDISGGHIGRAHSAATQPRPSPRIDPNTQSVGNLHGNLWVSDFDVSGGSTFNPNTGSMVPDVVQRQLQVMCARCGDVEIRYAWDPKEQKLYFSPDTDPPDWLVDGLWRRLVALDMGAIDDLFEVPIKPPPTNPSAVPPELEVVSGGRLDHLAAMQGLSRAEWVGGELETDKSLRARIHATVAKELGFDGAGKLLLGR